MSDGERDVLSAKPRRKNAAQLRGELAKADWQDMLLNEKFLRVLFTILSDAGMFRSDFHSDGRLHALYAGRRSLGLDILRTAEDCLGPDALLRILEAEKKTQIGGSYVTRSTDRDDERDGDDGADRRPVERYLEYPKSGS